MPSEQDDRDLIEGASDDDAVEAADDATTGDAVAEKGDDAAVARTAEDRRQALRRKAKQVTTKQRVSLVVVRAVIALVVIAAVVAAAIWIWRTVVPEVTEPAAEPDNFVEGGFSLEGRDLSSMLASATSSEDVDAEGDEDAQDDGAQDDGAQDDAESDEEAREPLDIHIYVDYLSEDSGAFERANAAQLAEWVTEEAVTVTYHPVALLTSKSNGTRFSQRAAAAAACVATESPDTFVAFNHDLLLNQPQIDTEGYSNSELADLATAVGAENTSAVRECIEDGRYTDWARASTNAALDGPLPGTDDATLTGAPMILIGGVPYTGAVDDAGELSQFVLTVESDEYFQTPEPTPSPSDG